jgi:hypothetical protein
MTNLPTIMTRRDKLTMSLYTCIFGFRLIYNYLSKNFQNYPNKQYLPSQAYNNRI